VPAPLRVLIPIALLVLVALLPQAASASSSQTMSYEAPKDLLNPATRESALDEIASFGVKSLRVVVYWHDVAPSADSRTKPDFDTTDPANYDWSRYDPVLDAAKARGWSVLLTLSGPVPKWATASRTDTVTRPDPSEFAQFVTAAARHYADRVKTWSIWNEPNQPQFLKPQYDAAHKPVSPGLYRLLYKAALKGFTAAKVQNPAVLMGETSPMGTGKVVAPLTFLRGALCLSASYKLQKGCGALPTAGYAHHAYTRKTGPTYVPPGPNNVTIGVLSRLTKALDRAKKAKAVTRTLPIYLTEFGIQSTPDPYAGVSYQQQAEFRAISERIAYDNPRVKAFSQYLLRDDDPLKGVSALQRYSGFESGLLTATGKAKPALAAFKLTLTARSRGSKASLWGIVRPATGVTTATIQYRNGSSGSFRDLKKVTTNATGVLRASAAYRKGRQYRLTWTQPGGTTINGGPIRAYP
jgi:GH35 family endo-1,4-beta-xylanase